MSNTYKETRLRWEKEQQLDGCCYVNGTCMVHDGAQPEKKEQEPPKTVELPLLCTCRSFNHPHPIGRARRIGLRLRLENARGARARNQRPR